MEPVQIHTFADILRLKGPGTVVYYSLIFINSQVLLHLNESSSCLCSSNAKKVNISVIPET